MRGWPRVRLVILIVVPFAFAGGMAAAGFGFILDDWYTLRNAHFDGVFSAAGGDQLLARPGAWVVYGFVFGLLDTVPLAILALLAVFRAGAAIALWRLLDRFLPERVAWSIGLVWLMLPINTSTEFWASGANISLAVWCGAAGCLAVGRSTRMRSTLVGCGLLVASVLLYEAVAPAAAVGVLALSRQRHPQRTASTIAAAVPGLAALGAGAIWILANWNPAKSPSRSLTDFSPALGAHFGWGVLGYTPLADIAVVAFLLLAAWSLGTVAAPSLLRPPRTAERLVVVGMCVLAVSLVPFAFYPYEPQGVGDRVNVASSIGAAMIWVAAGWMVWLHRRSIAVLAAGTVLVASTAVRARMIEAYAQAAADAEEVLDRVPCLELGDRIVAGPRPEVRSNVTSFSDDEDHLEPAVQLRADRPTFEVRLVEQTEVPADGSVVLDLEASMLGTCAE